MKLAATPLAGAYVVELERHEDDRGFFARTFCCDELAAYGLDTRIVQCSLSRNHRRGTLRGLHYQAAPHDEAKLVRCVRGEVFDVIVDLRERSPTLHRWYGVTLTAERGNALYIPEGLAHGFVTLTDDVDILYQISTRFRADAARGVRWDDPAFAIEWPTAPVVMSERDRTYPLLQERSHGR
jgi:dTDP-4-dehydrorhamnose 3,5-epimerase